MTLHLHREIEKLKKKLLEVGALVEDNFKKAVGAINNYNDETLEDAKALDDKIDEYEVEVEEECLKILALHQPVAIDLRFIIAVLKINNDLERVSDLAVNIVKQSKHMHGKMNNDVTIDLTDMSDKVRAMLKDSLDSLVNLNGDLARKVRQADDEVDDLHKSMYTKLEKIVQSDRSDAGYVMNLMQISRNLERIADLATNIAEDVIYMIDGKIVRHTSE